MTSTTALGEVFAMRVVITGAGGLVASALRKQFAGEDVIELRHGDLDVTHRREVLDRIADLAPELILNCAVVGVDAAEKDPETAHAVNVEGPGNVAEAAEQIKAELVHFSTNYVFDGIEEREYTIDDEPRPVNVYGRTKLEGEAAAAARCSRTYIVRTSWVFGERKSNFLSAVPLRLRRGETVSAIDDIWASTTFAPDLAARVAEIAGLRSYGTYHVTNSGVCSYDEFSRAAAQLTKADESLVRRVSHHGAYAAPRPHYTPMRCLRSEQLGLSPLRHWRDALKAYIDTL